MRGYVSLNVVWVRGGVGKGWCGLLWFTVVKVNLTLIWSSVMRNLASACKDSHD